MVLRFGHALFFFVAASAPAQLSLAERAIPHFEVHAEPRLKALARLGSLTNTSLLLEPGNLTFLRAPIDLTLDHTTLADVVTQILRGPASYTARQEGPLLILSTLSAPNRIATMQLGPLSFQEKSLSALIPSLGFRISSATGCTPMGYLYGGPLLALDIPAFQLPAATLEQVAAHVALAPEPTFWVVPPEPQSTGCIENSANHWMVGLYGFGRGFTNCNTAFRETIGADVTSDSRPARTPDTTCRDTQLPSMH